MAPIRIVSLLRAGELRKSVRRWPCGGRCFPSRGRRYHRSGVLREKHQSPTMGSGQAEPQFVEGKPSAPWYLTISATQANRIVPVTMHCPWLESRVTTNSKNIFSPLVALKIAPPTAC